MNNRNQEGLANNHEFSYDGRQEPPATKLLQQRILEKTCDMPQQSPARSTVINSHRVNQKNWFWWRMLPVSAVAALVLSITVLFNDLLPGSPEMVEISSSESILFVSDDLAWQDVILMHDELAFLDL